MRLVRFVVGFVAGALDATGLIRARNTVLRSVTYDGDTMNGFDLACDLMTVR